MERLIRPLSGIVAGLWLLAGAVWLNVPPRPNVQACGTAVEAETRRALAADPLLVEIRTPVECMGFSATELAGIIASTTPVPRPTQVLEPGWSPAPPASVVPRPRRTGQSLPPAPRRTTVPPTASPMPSSTPIPPATSSTPTPSPSDPAPTSSSPVPVPSEQELPA